MNKTKWALVATNSRNGNSKELVDIYSSAVFHALLRHERSRSDRDGSEFSLIVFNISGMTSDGRSIQQATRHIRGSMRSIDEIGWIDERSFGILLPVTKYAGGQKYVKRISSPVPCSVYSYPTHWFPGGGVGSGNDSRKSRKARENGFCFEEIFGQVFCTKIPRWKRALDIVGSLGLLIVLSPLMLLVSLYIKCVSPGKLLFQQKRVGYRGKIFTFLKFRTMHPNNDCSIHQQYLKELIRNGSPMEKLDAERDSRIIFGGNILRKSSIDELPQLFNVLRGDMSLVGPRPCIPYEAEEYLRWHIHRFDVLPGMTGLWQVSGKNKLSFEQMIRLDISYMNKLSLPQDLKILLLTIPTVFGMVFDAVRRKLGRNPLESAEVESNA